MSTFRVVLAVVFFAIGALLTAPALREVFPSGRPVALAVAAVIVLAVGAVLVIRNLRKAKR